jgi:uncharacterized protein (DUF2336 family)
MRLPVTEVNELKNIDQTAREEIASKVGRIMARESSGSDKEAAVELAKVLVEDVAVSVREALSKELRTCNFLPKEILLSLANDIEQVSMPFLVASQAMDDEFLEEIIHNCGDKAQEAVAARNGLSEAVGFAISDVACQDAVETLVENDTADVSKRSCDRVVDRFPQERSLLEKLASRADLPADIVERLIFKVSKRYGEYMTEKFDLSTDYASYLVSLANRQVFSRTLEMAPEGEVANYLGQLNQINGLSSDVLLNYLQNGNFRLFTAALAVLLDKPYDAVEARISTGDKKILARLLEAAGFARSVVGVLLIAYERLIKAS